MELKDDKITTFQGNWDQIIWVILKHYTQHPDLTNTYINYIPCFSLLNKNKPVFIISLIHKKKFILNSAILKKYSTSQCVAWLLWCTGKILDKIYETYDINLYWYLELPKFPVIHIKSKEDLYKYCIHTNYTHEWASRKSTSRISLQYLKHTHNLISSSVWSGIAPTKKLAIAKSISEVLERFSAWIAPKNEAPTLMSLNTQITKLLMGSYTISKSDKLFPITHLVTQEVSAIPWNLLFYPYDHNSVWNASSNGMSVHISKQQTIEGWLFELIERDAFVLSWLLRKWIYRLQKNKTIDRLVHKFWLNIYDLQLFVLHFDNPIPIVLSITKDGKKISTSLGVWYTLHEAISKSLSESGQFGKQNIETEIELQPDDSLIKMHIKHYVDENNFDKASWYYDLPLLSLVQAKKLYQPIKNSKQVIRYYDSIGTNLYSYQYKNPILSYYKRYCMRVISDNLLHIWFWEDVPTSILNSDRLKFRKEKLNVQFLNTEVHPFW